MPDPKSKIKILSIGSDRKLFDEGSDVSQRIKEYGNLVEEYHIVVFALASLRLKEKQIASNIWIYPTNSLSRWLYVRDATKIGKRLVKEKNFVRGLSVITTQDPFESGLVGLKIKKAWRLPLEVQLHTDPFSPYFSGIVNLLRKRIIKKVLAHTDAVRVVSQELMDQITPHTQAHIYVLPIYVDQRKVEEGRVSFDLRASYPWKFIMLMVSRLTEEKNVPLALKILKEVHKSFPETGLVIVGSGPEKNKLESLAQKLKLSDHVAFVGWQNDLASYYKTANAFLQTSFFEGYGLSLIEAGLSGLPIITTPVGIAKELENGKDAYIFASNDAESFTNGVIDLIENNYRRENLRINIKRTLQTKLISKENFLDELSKQWGIVAKKIS